MKSISIAVVLGVAIAVAVGTSCGPSLRRTYQSDNAFERCFDMDYNPGLNADRKTECWTVWLEKRVYNQPEDKIEYAGLRLAELNDGISIPGPPGPEGMFDERPSVGEIHQSGTEGRAEPPAMADGGVADAGSLVAPGQNCEMVCKTAFGACAQVCSGSVSGKYKKGCDSGYRACMKACFE